MNSFDVEYEMEKWESHRLRKNILSFFSEEFKKDCEYDIYKKYILDSLQNGKTPYFVIEELLSFLKNTQKDFTEYIQKSPPAPILLSTENWTKEQKEKFIEDFRKASK